MTDERDDPIASTEGRYLLGGAVRVLHRRPVDAIKSLEHDPNHASRH